MDKSGQPPIERDLERRRLLQFLFALRVLALVFGAFEAAAGMFLSHWPLVVVGAGTLSVGFATWIARALANRGRLQAAAKLAGFSLLAIAPIASTLAPYGDDGLVLVPIIAVAAVLPYLRGRALLVFLCIALSSIVSVVVAAKFTADLFTLPEPLGDIIDTLTAIAASSMVMLLLWQFSERLRVTLDEARQAVRIREEFLSIASHELRTPLTSLQLAVQGMQRSDASPQHVERALALVNRQVTKLARLVTEMLNVGRIQMGRLELVLEEVDLSAVVRDVAERFASDLANAKSPLELRLSPVVGMWDRDKLEQVVVNLLANAIKFGAAKPIVIVVERDSGHARLSVIDHGIGIAPEKIPRLFEKFERAVSARSYGGFGLGLFITRTIVEAMGGRARVESGGLGTGATFVVELPMEQGVGAAERR